MKKTAENKGKGKGKKKEKNETKNAQKMKIIKFNLLYYFLKYHDSIH